MVDACHSPYMRVNVYSLLTYSLCNVYLVLRTGRASLSSPILCTFFVLLCVNFDKMNSAAIYAKKYYLECPSCYGHFSSRASTTHAPHSSSLVVMRLSQHYCCILSTSISSFCSSMYVWMHNTKSCAIYHSSLS